MLKINNLSKSYGKKIIFKDVSIEFKPGLYVFRGINGSGKSTLLKVLSKMIYKTSGELINDISISYLPDKFSLPKLLTVKEYLKIIFKMFDMEYLVDKYIEKYKLENKRIGDLSKGNYQKVGLIQALLKNSDCYILDEPLEGLDKFAEDLFISEIKKHLDKNKIVILSLHGDDIFSDLDYEIFDVENGNIERRIKNEEAF